MKRQVTSIAIASVTFFVLLSAAGCKKDLNQSASSGDATRTTISRAALPQSAFGLWGNCIQPYNISGTNGICVPLGSCSQQNDGAKQKTGAYATGFQFNGCFKGGKNASSGQSEEAVFLADDVNNWTGNEFGFVKTLENNDLKAYVQGGGQYIPKLLLSNDNGYHTFKALARSSNSHQVDFYVDGNYKMTLTNNSGNYYNHYYYFVGTNHWYGGSNPSGQQIEMYNMVTY